MLFFFLQQTYPDDTPPHTIPVDANDHDRVRIAAAAAAAAAVPWADAVAVALGHLSAPVFHLFRFVSNLFLFRDVSDVHDAHGSPFSLPKKISFSKSLPIEI